MSKENVLIVGGGFGGVKVALELANDHRFSVKLLSERPDFRYYPTLYRTATGGRRANSSISLTSIFKDRSVELIQARAVSLDRKAKTITTEDGQILSYQTLVLALGVVTNYFNIKGLKQYAFGIKSLEDAEKLKHHLHQQLIDDHQPDLNYVIVGGGPTGIELAGALTHYLNYLMQVHGSPKKEVHIDLVEAESRILPNLPRDASRIVKRQLRRLGVQLFIGKPVVGETSDELIVGTKPIKSHTVIWTAGVTNNPFFKQNSFLITAHGKVATDIYLQAEDNIFVLGDNANTPYSGQAQTAIADGQFVATNLRRRASNKKFKSYVAKPPITVIPVGQKWAAVIWGKLRIYGCLGWMLREFADLIGFHDYEPWHKATEQWFTEFGSENRCLVCALSESR
ncbi:MAG TPA: FAD-dependent oxidoreductase [Candidatus Dormibacteraeota bacterium]|nr:FAD-dependent oxidoreductase [Candidatus Dormibacteraeota bacterium]